MQQSMTELPIWNYFYQLNEHKQQNGIETFVALAKKNSLSIKDMFVGALRFDNIDYSLLDIIKNNIQKFNDYNTLSDYLAPFKKIFIATNISIPITDDRLTVVRLNDELLSRIL